MWARVSRLSRGFFFVNGRGCASQVLTVDGVDLLIRKILILGMLSLTAGHQVVAAGALGMTAGFCWALFGVWD